MYWRNTCVVIKNNKAFSANINWIIQDKVFLNDITPFKWDIVYTFEPYTSRETTLSFATNLHTIIHHCKEYEFVNQGGIRRNLTKQVIRRIKARGEKKM